MTAETGPQRTQAYRQPAKGPGVVVWAVAA